MVEPTNASGAIWWTILQLMQIAPSGGQISNFRMQVAAPDGQNWNQCYLHYMLAKFGTNSGGITWWSNCGQVVLEKVRILLKSPEFRFQTGRRPKHRKNCEAALFKI